MDLAKPRKINLFWDLGSTKGHTPDICSAARELTQRFDMGYCTPTLLYVELTISVAAVWRH
jgi:hypothetical protein